MSTKYKEAPEDEPMPVVGNDLLVASDGTVGYNKFGCFTTAGTGMFVPALPGGARQLCSNPEHGWLAHNTLSI